MGTTNVKHLVQVYGDDWKTVDAIQFRQDVHDGKFIRDKQHRDARNDNFILLSAVTRLLHVAAFGFTYDITPGRFTVKDLVDLFGTFPKIYGIGSSYRSYLAMVSYGLFVKPKFDKGFPRSCRWVRTANLFCSTPE